MQCVDTTESEPRHVSMKWVLHSSSSIGRYRVHGTTLRASHRYSLAGRAGWAETQVGEPRAEERGGASGGGRASIRQNVARFRLYRH